MNPAMKQNKLKIILSAAAVILIAAGGVAVYSCFGKKNTVPSIPEPQIVFSTKTRKANPEAWNIEEKMLQMVANNEEPDTSFGEAESIEFSLLPKVIQEVDQGYRNLYEVCQEYRNLYPYVEYFAAIHKCDLNHDGKDELIATFRGDYGSGGSGYHVFSFHKGKLIYSGHVFGVTVLPMSFKGRHGIYQEYRMGCDERIISFDEFVNGKLVTIVSINLQRPIIRGKDANLTLTLKSKSSYAFDSWF